MTQAEIDAFFKQKVAIELHSLWCWYQALWEELNGGLG